MSPEPASPANAESQPPQPEQSLPQPPQSPHHSSSSSTTSPNQPATVETRPSTTPPDRFVPRLSLLQRPPTSALPPPIEQPEDEGGELLGGRKRASLRTELLNEKEHKERAEVSLGVMQVLKIQHLIAI